MDAKKNIALVAHDNRKKDLVEWVKTNWEELIKHELTCTGTTGRLVEEALREFLPKEVQCLLKITKLKSGPLGGDQQLGALISEGKIDMMIFLWDPMQAQPHDVDVKALLRIIAVYNVPLATNRATADFIFSSPYMQKEYNPLLRDYSGYIKREID